MDLQPSDVYVKKVLGLARKHFRKYGFRKMTGRELDELFGKLS